VGDPYSHNLVTNLKSDPRIAKVRIVNIDPRLSRENYQQLYSNPKSIPLPMAAAVQQLSSKQLDYLKLD